MNAITTDQIEIKGGNTTNYVIQRKHDHGLDMIDLRKWILFPNANEYFPSRSKGICIPVQKWREIIPILQKMVKDGS